MFRTPLNSAVDSSPLSPEGANSYTDWKCVISRDVAASSGVAGLVPASLKLCNSFVRPQIAATVQREQLPTHLATRLSLCSQAIISENIGTISLNIRWLLNYQMA
jgi:hypothetical protein